MRVLVTGGAGFIGSHVADQLLVAGHQVAIVDDLSTGRRENLPAEASFYEGDIRDPDRIEEIFRQEGIEVVSHQAALANVRASMEQPILYADVNILGSLVLLEVARRHGCRKFLYASTGGAVYGEGFQRGLPFTEESDAHPLDCYGASKYAFEHYLYLYNHNYGLDYAALRYPNVYGPRQDPHGEAGVVAIFTGAMLHNQVVTINGSGEQLRDYTYVGDIARANVLALDKGTGIYNVGTGVGTSVNTLYQELRELTECTMDAVYGPPKLGEVKQTYLDAGRARAGLGWEPTVDLRTGLQQTVEYFRSRQL